METVIDRPLILPSPFVPQPDLLENKFWSGYILNGATLPPPVTF
jgi:hypothetical protein